MGSIIIKEIREFFRNPASVFMGLLFPVLLVFFLGTMLQGIDIADYDIGEINIQYSVSDADKQSASAFESFLGGIDVIKSGRNNDREKALSAADSGEIDAYVELADGEIRLYSGKNSIANRALVSVLNSYIAVSDTYYKIAAINPSMLMNLSGTETESSFVEQEGLGISRSMIDYYAISMAVMMIFMSHIIMGAEAFNDEKKTYTMARLYTSPLGKLKIFFGKIIGILPSAVICNLTIMLFSAYGFGAHYCDNFGGNVIIFLMLCCCSAAAIAFGMLVGIIIKAPPEGVVIPVAWALLFFSGSFSKEIFFEGFSTNLPPYLIQQAAFKLTLYNESASALTVIAAALGVSVVLAALGAVVFSRKKEI